MQDVRKCQSSTTDILASTDAGWSCVRGNIVLSMLEFHAIQANADAGTGEWLEVRCCKFSLTTSKSFNTRK